MNLNPNEIKIKLFELNSIEDELNSIEMSYSIILISIHLSWNDNQIEMNMNSF